MNDWGIPDWQRSEAYGAVHGWSWVRWRWEFIRRNPDYRHDAMTFFGILDEREAAAAEHRKCRTKETHERFALLADRQERAFSALWQRWGYPDQVPDPRVSGYPDERLKTLPHDAVKVMAGSPSSEAGLSALAPRIGEAAILFRLDKPVAEQLETAKKALLKLQAERHGKPLQRRRHPTKWLTYLRALDAKEAGASWAEMTAQFFSERLLPQRPAPEGGYCDPPPQAARDIWEAANTLRSNF